MTESFCHDLQGIELEEDDADALEIPDSVYAEAEEKNQLSIVGMLLNPKSQNLRALLATLPKVWGLEGKVQGRAIGENLVQFRFQDESDMRIVDSRGPWSFNDWMLGLRRWEQEQGPTFLYEFPMWVQIWGITIKYLPQGTVEMIERSLGSVLDIDFDDETATTVKFFGFGFG